MRARPPSLRRGIFSHLAILTCLVGIAVGSVQAYTSPGGSSDDPVRPGEGILIGPFVFSPSVSVNTAYDDNIFSVDKGTCAQQEQIEGGNGSSGNQCRVGGTLMTARGQFTMKLPFSHSYVSLALLPQYREYAKFKTPLSSSHTLSLDSLLRFSNGSTVQISDDYDRGYQEARRLDPTGQLQFSSTGYTRNNPQVRYDWSIGGSWGFMGKIERTDVVYKPTSVIDFSSFVGGSGDERSGIFEFFDYVTDRVESGGYLNLSRTRVSASAGVGRTVQDRSNFNASQQRDCQSGPHSPGQCQQGTASETINESWLDVGITGQIFPSTQADLRVGWDKWRFSESGTPNFSSASVAASIDHVFNRRTRGTLEIKRAPIQATGQLTGYYVRENVTVGLERQITMQITTRASLGARRYSYSGSTIEGSRPFSLTDYSGELEVLYQPSSEGRRSPYLVSLLYSPLRRVATLNELEYESQRVTLSFFYGWF